MYWPALGQWTRPVFASTRRNPAAVMRAVATSSVVNLSDVYAGVDEQQASLRRPGRSLTATAQLRNHTAISADIAHLWPLRTCAMLLCWVYTRVVRYVAATTTRGTAWAVAGRRRRTSTRTSRRRGRHWGLATTRTRRTSYCTARVSAACRRCTWPRGTTSPLSCCTGPSSPAAVSSARTPSPTPAASTFSTGRCALIRSASEN